MHVSTFVFVVCLYVCICVSVRVFVCISVCTFVCISVCTFVRVSLCACCDWLAIWLTQEIRMDDTGKKIGNNSVTVCFGSEWRGYLVPLWIGFIWQLLPGNFAYSCRTRCFGGFARNYEAGAPRGVLLIIKNWNWSSHNVSFSDDTKMLFFFCCRFSDDASSETCDLTDVHRRGFELWQREWTGRETGWCQWYIF